MGIKKKKKGPTVFLSHSSSDKEIVNEFNVFLRNLGLETWLDEIEINPGESLVEKISEGIERSDYFMIFFSKKSVESMWVSREIDIAVSQASKRNVPIIPIQLEEGTVPTFFQGMLYIDLTKLTIASAWEKLTEFFQSESQGLLFTRSKSELHETKKEKFHLLKSPPTFERCIPRCLSRLLPATIRFLRKALSDCLDRNEICTVWYDLFETKLDDQLPQMPLPNCIIEMIDKAEKKGLSDELVSIVCEDHCASIIRRFP